MIENVKSIIESEDGETGRKLMYGATRSLLIRSTRRKKDSARSYFRLTLSYLRSLTEDSKISDAVMRLTSLLPGRELSREASDEQCNTDWKIDQRPKGLLTPNNQTAVTRFSIAVDRPGTGA